MMKSRKTNSYASHVPDFTDGRHEWRRIFAEVWGTFLLVMVALGADSVAASFEGTVTLAMRAVAPGLMVMTIIYSMGAVSGAHLNPAVTLAFTVRGNFPWRRVPGYLIAQIFGGILAALFVRSFFGTSGDLGATIPGHGITDSSAFFIEFILTLGLIHTILATASGAQNIGANGALAVGAYITLAGLWAKPVTGASMNPVRSFSPDLIRGNLGSTWIYVVAPLMGSLVAVFFEWILKGTATASGRTKAQGEE